MDVQVNINMKLLLLCALTISRYFLSWNSFEFLTNKVCSVLADDYVVSNKKFPSDFKWGTASAAYQIEGGWDADGKGENVWDRSTHEHPELNNYENGDVACDSYNKWEEDVELLVGMGVNTYRFSIAWSRVLPTG